MKITLFPVQDWKRRYSTERSRNIAANTPFSILGTIHVPLFADVLHKMDRGSGLLHRFLVYIPQSLRPSSNSQRQARASLHPGPANQGPFQISSLSPVSAAIEDYHSVHGQYSYTLEAEEQFESFRDVENEEINKGLEEGLAILPSKRTDHILRLSFMVHVCEEPVNVLINGNEFYIDEEIDLDILNAVVSFVDFPKGQKHTFLNVSKPVLVVCPHSPLSLPFSCLLSLPHTYISTTSTKTFSFYL